MVPDDSGGVDLRFDEFAPSEYAVWRRAAEETLKGAPFEKRLVSRTYEGLDLQPIYWREDSADLAHLGSLPGLPPFVRGADPLGALGRPRQLCQALRLPEPVAWNAALRHDLERGQTAVDLSLADLTRRGFDAATPAAPGRAGLFLAALSDLEHALDGVDLSVLPLYAEAAAPYPVAALVLALARRRGLDPSALSGALAADPLGDLARAGALSLPLGAIYDDMAELTLWAIGHAPQLATVAVDSGVYHEAGASAVQELAFALATAVDYLRAMLDRGLTIDAAAPRVRMSFALGPQVFMEIARLRAARLLWAQVVAAFGGSAEAQRLTVHTRTGLWNKTIHDPYVNMLRTTAEAFAATVGGCDSLDVGAFDEPVRPPDELARRIARNTQIILRDEASLDRVVDPAGGAYYTEQLTDQVARAAWALFQEIERHGGMAAALRENIPQEMVAEVVAQRDAALAARRDVLVGVNMYANPGERPLSAPTSDEAVPAHSRAAQLRAAERPGLADALAALRAALPGRRLDLAIAAALAGATVGEIGAALDGDGVAESIKPLQSTRGAEPFERLRARASAAVVRGAPVRAFLANMGPLKQHKARADFSAGFLQIAGIEVIYAAGFETAEAAAAAAAESGAPIVVVCSTDENYPKVVPVLVGALKAARPQVTAVVAGYPTDQVEALRAAGIDEFIHVRANVVETLGRLLERAGAAAA